MPAPSCITPTHPYALPCCVHAAITLTHPYALPCCMHAAINPTHPYALPCMYACSYYAATVITHEVGHNWNLMHANLGLVEYDDDTDIMVRGYRHDGERG